MRYKNINELDNRIEKIVDTTIKYYYTDWKHYDRPKYMKFKGSNDADDKKLVLLVSDTGTYLVRVADALTRETWGETLYEYFQTQDHKDYYYIDINKFECRKLNPTLTKQELKTA